MAKKQLDTKTAGFLTRLEFGQQEDDWNIPAEYPDLSGCAEIGLDLETKDPNLTTLGPGWTRNDGYIVGIAIATGDQEWYFPIRHKNGHNLDPKMTMRWLKKQLSREDLTVVMHNATYDAGWLRSEGVEVKGRIVDTMIAAPLVDENRFSYSLNNLGRDYIDMRKDERMLRAAGGDWGLDAKKDLWQLPAQFVGGYAEQAAAMTLKLWRNLQTHITREELGSIFTLETGLIPLMLDMKSRGVAVDLDKADMARKGLRSKVQELKAFIKHRTGVAIEPWAADSVRQVFDSLNLQYPETEAGAPSFTKQFLNAHPHEVAGAIVKLREFDKADGTFIETILQHEHKGRIHCEFHQLRGEDGGTVTGRFSSSNPNLQQIPARVPELKALIRGLFVPEPGAQWGSFDYSSQEPRLLVHFAASLPDSMRGPVLNRIVDEYNRADVDLHQMTADIAGISRKEAKAVNLGIMYGMGFAKLANELGISVEEAKRIMSEHEDKVPFVRQLATLASKQAEKHGQVRTLLGRKGRFHLYEPSHWSTEYKKPLPLEDARKEYGPFVKRAFTYKALNKLIQGSAADQTKKAMADCYAEGLIPSLTVHDELCFSVESPEQADRIKEIMETGVTLKVPSKVDAELGSNWGEVG